MQILVFTLCFITSTAVFSQSSTDELKALIAKNPGAIGIANEANSDYIINSNYKDKVTGIEHVYIQQTHKNIKVFNVIISLAFKNGSLIYKSGKFIDPLKSFGAIEFPVIEAGNAVYTAASHLNLKATNSVKTVKNNFKIDKKIIFSSPVLSGRNIETELLWVQDDSGKVRLAWNVNIDLGASKDWWNIRVDALTGEIVNKDNWTVHENYFETDEVAGKNQPSIAPSAKKAGKNLLVLKDITATTPAGFAPPNVQNAAYRVLPFPTESRNFGNPALENDPWLKAGAINDATTFGWHFDGNTNYSATRGNNVFAYDDSASINNPGRFVSSSTMAPFVNFDLSPNFSVQPFDSANRNFGIVNLFYWNNIVHDLFYQYGFTESAGNFQANNLGRGGSQNDYVRAEAQDGSGTDNANFTTPADGASGRMQMYLFSGVPDVNIISPASIAMKYVAKESQLSANNKLYKIGQRSGQLVYYDDASSGGTTHDACDSSTAPLQSVAGKIVYINRGGCPFTTKMRSAQKAGAIGVFMVNNIPGPPIGLGGTDNGITIPGIMVSKDDGAKIALEIQNNILVTFTGGLLYDGGIDNGIVTHEYVHGISNRLTGGRTNSSCLNNAEQGGEGWSDYAALMLTTNWQNAQLTDGNRPRAIGTYTLGETAAGSGIRRVPYTTDLLIDTLTYGSMDGIAGGNGEVHRIGEIWCSALWDMTWNIIRHEGAITPDLYNSSGNGGNIIAMKLVMEGMKLQPCRPGFLDSRNAILAADSILFNYSHKCDIWNAFARRGMGYSAVQGSSNSTGDQIPAFDVPSGITISRSAAPSIVNSGAEISINTTIRCQCDVPAEAFTATDTIPAGFTFVSSTNGVLQGNVVQFNPIAFSHSLEAITLELTLRAASPGCTISKPINDDRETNVVGGLVAERITGTTANWLSSTNRFFSGTNAWYAANPGSANNITLTSSEFIPGSLSILSFWHYFETEIFIDGAKVEISSNNGSTWIDAKSYFLQNGYNGLLNAASPQPLTYAFTGTSYTSGSTNSGRFIQSVMDLSSFANQPIKIRFRYQTNANNAGNQNFDGWYIDDIVVTNGCGGIGRLAFSNALNIKLDSAVKPIFIMANSILPLTLVNFSANQTGKEVLLNWITNAEINTKSFDIERSADGIYWAKIGTVNAAGSGENHYTYNDQNPTDYRNFYRLKINDKDGRFYYSPIKKIAFDSNNTLSVIPNPAINNATVYFGTNFKDANISVSDMKGSILLRYTIRDNKGFQVIPTSHLPSGTYLIRLQSKTGVSTRKLVVAH